MLTKDLVYLVAFLTPYIQPLCNLCLDPKSCMAVWLSSICLPRKLFNDRSLLSNMMLLCQWVLVSTAHCKVHHLLTSYFRHSHLTWADLHSWANFYMKSYLNYDIRDHSDIYYVSTLLSFLDPTHPQPYVSKFCVLKISKNCHFLTPLPL